MITISSFRKCFVHLPALVFLAVLQVTWPVHSIACSTEDPETTPDDSSGPEEPVDPGAGPDEPAPPDQPTPPDPSPDPTLPGSGTDDDPYKLPPDEVKTPPEPPQPPNEPPPPPPWDIPIGSIPDPEPPPTPDPAGTDPNDCTSVNAFTVSNGNAHRRSVDLSVSGAVSGVGLVWARYHNTVPQVGASQPQFGSSNNWRHSWQYELLESRYDSNSIPRFEFVYPSGARRVLRSTGGNVWSADENLPEQATGHDGGIDVELPNGSKVFFSKTLILGGVQVYRPTKYADNKGLVTNLDHDSHARLVRITEPAGRWLTIGYGDLSANAARWHGLGRAVQSPTVDASIDVPVSYSKRPLGYRYLRIRHRLGHPLAIASVQFFAPDGSSIAVTPVAGLGNSNVQVFDPGAPVRVDHVQVRATTGAENELLETAFEGQEAANDASSLITSVASSDGQIVIYDYDTMDTKLGTKAAVLKKVRYDDNTEANYIYTQNADCPTPLLVEADEPRYIGNAHHIRYTYQVGRAGMIHQEINPTTGSVWASLELDPNDQQKRIVQYSDEKAEVYHYDATQRRLEEKIDALGRHVKFEYAQPGIGRAIARIDHKGRRTEWVQDSRGRVIQRKLDGKTTAFVVRDANGRILKRSDRYNRETSITRDDRGLLQKVVYPDGTTEELSRNSLGQRTSHRDRNGGVHQFKYDGRGLLIAWTDSLGSTTQYTYDSHDRLGTITNAVGQKTSYERNGRGLTTKVTHPDGTTHAYKYDKYGRVTATTNSLGFTTQNSYDELGRLIGKIDVTGGVTTFDYAELPTGCSCTTLSSRPTRVVLPNGFIRNYLYDAGGRLLSKTTAVGTKDAATTTYTYDDDNNLVAVTDPLDRTSRFTYDDEERRLSVTNPAGHVKLYSRDAHGNVIKVTRPNGTSSNYEYDANDRLVHVVDDAGGHTRFTYDATGHLSALTDARGDVRNFQHDIKGHYTAMVHPDGKKHVLVRDAKGRIGKSTSPDGVETTQVYDAGDRIVSSKDSTGRSMTYTHDAFGHRTSATDMLGRTTRWTYDTRGNVVTAVRPDSGKIVNTFDAGNQLLSTTGADGKTTTYNYDSIGNIISMTDANGNTDLFTYDGQRRKTSTVYPDGSKETWAYDLCGQLTGYTNRLGQTKTVVYNTAGQPTSESWIPSGAAPSIAYTYDAAGRLIALNNGLARLSYTYDESGKLSSETTDVSALVPGLAPSTVGYSYDKLGRRQGLIYPNGPKISYSYDHRSRLVSVDGDGRGMPLAVYSYDSLGRIAKLSRNNGVETAYGYDIAGRLTDIAHTKAGQTLATSHYELDALGRRSAQSREDNQTERYTYDTGSQITGVDYGTGKTEVFAYDAVGNRQTSSVADGRPSPHVTSYATNNLNQYTQIGGIAYAYDANGNLLTDGTQDYAYNANNQLIAVEGAATRAEFYYDARNRCVLRKYFAKGTQGQWILNQTDSRTLTYDADWNLLAERKLNGQQVGVYIHGQRREEVISVALGANLYYPVADGLGSTVALTNTYGKVVERYRTSAYGTPTVLKANYQPMATLATGYRFLFTGREWLTSVGLIDLRNRYYSPVFGRWLNTDPIGFRGGLNLYVYCYNSPSMSTDSFGLDCTPCDKAQAKAWAKLEAYKNAQAKTNSLSDAQRLASSAVNQGQGAFALDMANGAASLLSLGAFNVLKQIVTDTVGAARTDSSDPVAVLLTATGTTVDVLDNMKNPAPVLYDQKPKR